jgi:hypothetical protein
MLRVDAGRNLGFTRIVALTMAGRQERARRLGQRRLGCA